VLIIDPENDIWNSFNKNINSVISSFINRMKMSIINCIGVDNYDDYKVETNWIEFQKFLNIYDEKRGDREGFTRENINNNVNVSKWLNKEESTLDLLNRVLDPKENDIKLIKYDGSVAFEKNREMWTDSKSLLIRKSELKRFFYSIK